MSPVEQYLRELSGALVVRGRARRRLLQECRDHLRDAAAVHGEQEAVRRFGPAREIAASFDREVAARRAGRATVVTVVAVAAVAVSTLALLHSADRGASATAAWVLLFFGSAQTTAVSLALAALQALAMRRQAADASAVALLCRRNGAALAFAAVTLVSAAGAVPGHGPAPALLAGPVLAALAAVVVLRTRALARRLGGRRRAFRSPPADLAALVRLPLPDPGPTGVLLPVALLASVGAYGWDHGEQGTVASSLTAAALEAAMVVIGFVLLGPALGLRPTRDPSRRRDGSAT